MLAMTTAAMPSRLDTRNTPMAVPIAMAVWSE
jgi:hypothetical protein